MNDMKPVSPEARAAADFLQPMDSRFDRHYVEQTVQKAIELAVAEATRPLLDALFGLVAEADYSASSGLPFNAAGNEWTQLANARSVLAAHRANEPGSEKCPNCGSTRVERPRHNPTFALPECNCLFCENCNFSWGHS